MDLFGLSSLMLPAMLSSMTGADGILCLLLGMAGGGLLLLLLRANLQKMRGDYYSYMKDTAGQFLGDIFMVFYFLYFITLCGFVLYQTTVLVLTWLLPDGSYFWVSILLLLLAAYGTIRGIEGRARVYEIIFWFLGIPLLVMLFLAFRNVNTDYWTPVAASDGKNLLDGSIAFWIFLLPVSAIMFLKPFCRKTEKMASAAGCALVGVTLMNGLIYLVLLGVFGRNTMDVLKRPVITLMSMINLPGGFLTRQDVVMASVWFFSLFALMHTGVFQGTLILKELCHESGNRYSLCIALILAFLLGIGFFENTFLTEVYEIYQRWVALPGMVLIPLVLLLTYRLRALWKTKKGGSR